MPFGIYTQHSSSTGWISRLSFFVLFVWGAQGRSWGGLASLPNGVASLARAQLLLVGSALLGGRVVQAHVLLACPSARHPQVLGHVAISKQPLLGGLRGFARLGKVLPKRKQKQQVMAQQS